MTKRRKTNPDGKKTTFNADLAIMLGLKLFQMAMNHLEEEAKIPPKPPARKTQRT